MDIMSWIREQEAHDAFLLGEEFGDMNIRQIARDFARRTVAEYELMEEGMPVLIPVDKIIHTDEAPYCPDESCPCHDDAQLFGEYVLTPFMDGLQTFEEANALRWGENV